MLLYQILRACGLDRSFLRFMSRLPAHFQRRLGLVPVRASK